jgi:hypothetical protein
MPDAQIPLFPLQTVLFPGRPLPLRIFEPRYLSMISRCFKSGAGFGVVLIRSGSETGEAEVYDVGTLAAIIDWQQGRDGVLGITAEGRRRFRLTRRDRQRDGLYVGDVDWLPGEPRVPLAAGYEDLRDLLKMLLADLGTRCPQADHKYDDATWLGYRLAEILPLKASIKQSMLEMTDARERLDLLRPHVERQYGTGDTMG